MSISAAAFILGRRFLPSLYTGDPAIIATCAALLPIAAAFQLFDGVQVVGGGILRGMGRTRPAAVFNLIGYYVLALPAAYWLAFPGGYGLPGMWWGLALGLAVIAAALVLWVWLRGPARVDARVAVPSESRQPSTGGELCVVLVRTEGSVLNEAGARVMELLDLDVGVFDAPGNVQGALSPTRAVDQLAHALDRFPASASLSG